MKFLYLICYNINTFLNCNTFVVLLNLLNYNFRPHINSDVELCTYYLELLCRYESDAVMDYVKTNDSLCLTKAISVRVIIVLLLLFFFNSIF